MSPTALLIAIVVAAAPAFAADYNVGDGAGWSLGQNYSDWANGKDFGVGDTLTFFYAPGVHNVLEVSRGDWEGCTSSDPAAVPYISGNDTITLDSPGDKWYICDIDNHCAQGMNLPITVSQRTSPPTGSSQAGEITPFTYAACLLLLMAHLILTRFDTK